MKKTIDIIFKIIKEYKNIDNEALEKLKIKTLVTKCLNYCNIEELPPELYSVLAEHLILSDGVTGGKEIASVKEGDTTITYSDGSNVNNTFLSLRPQLNKFRRIGVIG